MRVRPAAFTYATNSPRTSLRSIVSQYHAYRSLSGHPGMDTSNGASSLGLGLMSPRQLSQYLDSYVVGQERAKKILSVAIFNHYNRVRANIRAHEDATAAMEWSENSPIVELEVRGDDPARPTIQTRPHHRSFALPHPHPRHPPLFDKSNILLLGPTGSGKTLLARTLARVLDVPFAISDATSLTQAGYVGEDVESVVQRLLQAANWDTQRASYGIICIDECDKLAKRGLSGAGDGGRDVGGEGVQQALLRMLEGTIVNVKGGGLDGNAGNGPNGNSIDGIPSGPSSTGRRKGTGPTSSGLPAPPKSDTYQVDTTDILFILSGAFVGLENIIKSRIAKGSIGFNAPIASKSTDFLAPSKDDRTSSSFTPFFSSNNALGKEPLHLIDLVEPTDLTKFGFIPEFVGRLPTTAVLRPLSSSDLLRVLTEVRGALAKQYESLFAYSGIEIRFTTLALMEICEIAVKRGGGARALRGIMESLLLEPMYDCPGSSVRYVLIDQAVVRGERPAHYWSRSEGASFYSVLAAEEEKWEASRSVSDGEAGGLENPPSSQRPPRRRRGAASP